MPSFQPLNGILHSLEQNQSSWRSRKQFNTLVLCWPQVVGGVVAAQTRPVALQRGTLIVATSSAAWAQNLAFERQVLLQKLKRKLGGIILPDELVDIRFSTTHWSSRSSSADPAALDSEQVWQEHPSYLPPHPSRPSQVQPSALAQPTKHPHEPKAAFQQWAAHMQERSRHLPLCPQCQCPTPQGELDRWAMCALCAPKHWMRSPHP